MKIITLKEACRNLDEYVKKMKEEVRKRREQEYEELEMLNKHLFDDYDG